MMIIVRVLLVLAVQPMMVKLEIEDLSESSESTTSDLEDSSQNQQPRVTILGALAHEKHMRILAESQKSSDPEIDMTSCGFVLQSNPILTVMELCDLGNQSQAQVIILGHSDERRDPLTFTAIAYVSEFYHIPLLSIGSRENIFSDKDLYNFIVRLIPPYFYEADIWFRIIRQLEYTKVVLIHGQEEESRMAAARFQILTDDSDIQIERIEEYTSDTNFTSLISTMTSEDRLLARVFIIHTSPEDTEKLLTPIVKLQRLENFVWILNERAITSKSFAFFDGLLGIKLHDMFNEENLLADAIQLISKTFEQFLNYPAIFWSRTPAPIDCSSTKSWSHGREVYRKFIQTIVARGKTGNISFNQHGDRLESLYQIINIQQGSPKVIGTYLSDTTVCHTSSACREIIEKKRFELDKEKILWPGGLVRKPDGILTRQNISVVTIVEKPFTFARFGNDCDLTFEVPCRRKKLNVSHEEFEHFCCYGYCVTLLKELSKNLSFVFTLHLVADNKYGSFERDGDGKQKRWDGMIGELINYQADMIVAPLTMSPERTEDIEFTKPFKYQGITILVQKSTSTSNLDSFLQPFKEALWLMVLLCVHLVAIALYLLDRFSPKNQFRFSPHTTRNQQLLFEESTNNSDGDDSDGLSLSRALWFTWGVLLNSGIAEGTPRSFSARVLGMVWAGFAMIMVASYTANLAAFLVLDRPEASISGINDARLRNPQDGFTYATVKGSSVDMYFKRQVELSTMHRTMESKNYLSVEQAIEDLRNGKLNAFIWDSPRLEYEASQDCNLVTAGELFGRSSYGIAMRKNDPWINPLSHTILSFHEKGFMELLDNEWIFSKNSQQCVDPSSSPATLGVNNMLGVFLLVIGGVIVGCFLLIIEVIFRRRKASKEREIDLLQPALIKWKMIEKLESHGEEQETNDSGLCNEVSTNHTDHCH